MRSFSSGSMSKYFSALCSSSTTSPFITCEGLEMATAWPKLDEGGVEALSAWLGERPDARLVAVDTLAKIRPRARGQNVYQEDYAASEELLSLAAEHEVAIVVVHHTRKMAAADPLDEISGSTGLTGGVDGVLVLKRDRGKADAVLHVDGRDIEEPAEYALKWDAETAGWAIAGDAEEYRMSEERKEILGVLTESGELLSPGEVADALGKPRNTVKQRLWRMAQGGQVESHDGKYGMTHNRVTDEKGGGYPVTAVIGYSESSEPVGCIHGYPEGAGCYLCNWELAYPKGGAP